MADMRTSKEITEYFINKGFQPKQLRSLSALGLKAFYKREVLNYSPSMLTEDEFISLYTVHATNLGDDKVILSEEQLNKCLNGVVVHPVSKISSEWSYPQRNFRAGHQVILVPRPYLTTSGMLAIEKDYKPRIAETAIINDEIVVPFHGYDAEGVAYPFGIDFVKLFNVGTLLPVPV